MIALKMDKISFAYERDKKIFSEASLEIEKGNTVAICGGSGSGKSTLALIMCGVIPKSIHGYFDGDVFVFGNNIEEKEIFESAADISMVFQDPDAQLFSSMVMDEIAFAPENLCYEQKEIINSVKSAASVVGADDLLGFSPNDLSYGQKQLIALASILSLDPNIIILDEVTAHIDSEGGILIRKAIVSLKQKGKTIVIIDHKGEFSDLCDRKFLLECRKIKETL